MDSQILRIVGYFGLFCPIQIKLKTFLDTHFMTPQTQYAINCQEIFGHNQSQCKRILW